MDSKLREIIKRIVDGADPDTIILLGSQAKQKNKEYSDYDICVLKKDVTNRRKLAQKIYQKTRIICGAVFAVALLALYRFRQPGFGTLHDSFLLLLVCSPVVHPWYVTWLAVLLPMARRWSGIVYAATVSLTSFTVLDYALHGTWTEYPLAMVVEYVPVLLLLGREMVRKETAL